MNIVVPVKSVIDVELNIRVRDGKVVEDGMNYILSKWDENAVEAALQIKEAVGGEVTVISVGPERAGEVLRKALAMGADKAVHVNDPAVEGSDSFGYARVLAAAIGRDSYDLVITGRQAQDTDMGGTGPILAEMLGWPQVVNVVQVEPAEGQLTVQRKGDVGVEVFDVKLPALLTANDSLNEPRLASLRGIMGAKKKPMETLTLSDLGVDAGQVGSDGARAEIVEFAPPKGREAGRKFEGEPDEVAKEVAELLVNEAKIFS